MGGSGSRGGASAYSTWVLGVGSLKLGLIAHDRYTIGYGIIATCLCTNRELRRGTLNELQGDWSPGSWMKILLLQPKAQVFRRVPSCQHPTTTRWLHNPASRIKHGRSKEKAVSLFDELFPEDKDRRQKKSRKADTQIPRLPLSDIDHLDLYGRRGDQSKRHANKLAEGAAQSAVKQWNPAVLVLQRASKSLIDADFRRVSPKGRHIEEWTGPGDILKGSVN